MAADYFQVQQKLTNQIANREDRERARLIDAKEQEVYLNWRDQAFKTLGQAQLIMIELHDMNIIITKQSPIRPLRSPLRGLPDHPTGHHPPSPGAGEVPAGIGPHPGHLRRSHRLTDDARPSGYSQEHKRQHKRRLRRLWKTQCR